METERIAARQIGPVRRRHDFFNTLFQRGFAQLIASEALVDIGVLARVAAQSWVAYDLTGSNLSVGVVAGIRAVPSLIVPIFAGAIADRFNRRMLVAVARLLLALIAIIQGILIGTGIMHPWHQLTLALASGIAFSAAAPAFWAFLTDMVEPRLMPRANAMVTFAHNAGEMIGPAIVGIIIATVGPEWPFGFVAILYIVGAFLILKVPYEPKPSTQAVARLLSHQHQDRTPSCVADATDTVVIRDGSRDQHLRRRHLPVDARICH